MGTGAWRKLTFRLFFTSSICYLGFLNAAFAQVQRQPETVIQWDTFTWIVGGFGTLISLLLSALSVFIWNDIQTNRRRLATIEQERKEKDEEFREQFREQQQEIYENSKSINTLKVIVEMNERLDRERLDRMDRMLQIMASKMDS